MRVLVIEDEFRAAAEAVDRLEAAGHEVSRCHDSGEHPFPCRGMPAQSGCPLDGEPIDAALSVRRSGGELTIAEDGVRCALRRHVPTVAAGASDGAPWAELATVVEPDISRVVEAVERARAAPLRRHSETASTELRRVLEQAGIDATQAMVQVHRVAGGLRAELVPGRDDVHHRLLQAAGVRVAAALRAIDHESLGVDVVVVDAAAR